MHLIRCDRTRAIRWVALGDNHAPFGPDEAWDWACENIRKFKPNVVIHLGDWGDYLHAGLWKAEKEITQADEYTKIAKQANQLRRTVPRGTPLIRLIGNHEDRLESHCMNIPKPFRESLHWKGHTALAREWRLWKEVPYIKGREGCYRVGDVIFYHGWDTGASSEELEAIQMAIANGGKPNTLCVRGHTHCPILPTQATRTRSILLPWWYMNAGHLGPIRPDYTRRVDTSRWAHAIAMGYAGRDGGWSAETVIRGSANANSDVGLGVANSVGRRGAR